MGANRDNPFRGWAWLVWLLPTLFVGGALAPHGWWALLTFLVPPALLPISTWLGRRFRD